MKKRYKFIHETEDKYEDKISLKDDIKCTIYTPRMSIRSMQFMHRSAGQHIQDMCQGTTKMHFGRVVHKPERLTH